MTLFSIVLIMFDMTVGSPYKTQVPADKVMSQVIQRSAALVGPQCWSDPKLGQCLELADITYHHGWKLAEDAAAQDFCNAGSADPSRVYGCIRFSPEDVPFIVISDLVPTEWIPTVLTHEMMHFMQKCLDAPLKHCGAEIADIASDTDKGEC